MKLGTNRPAFRRLYCDQARGIEQGSRRLVFCFPNKSIVKAVVIAATLKKEALIGARRVGGAQHHRRSFGGAGIIMKITALIGAVAFVVRLVGNTWSKACTCADGTPVFGAKRTTFARFEPFRT